MDDRRRHVRAKPTVDLPAYVLSMVSPAITEPLDVVDISVGGIGILQGMRRDDVGTTVALRLVLPSATFAVDASIRWVAQGVIGLELVAPSEDVSAAIRRYVSELLQRGSRT